MLTKGVRVRIPPEAYPFRRKETILEKKIFGIAIVLFLLTGCVRNADVEQVDQKKIDSTEESAVTEEETVTEETVVLEETTTEEKTEATNIAFDIDPLVFDEFTVEMNYVELYQKDGKEYADVSFTWLNQAGDGAKKFMSQSLVSLYQNHTDLDETTGAWDIENSNSSSLYYDNAENGELNIFLTYELENKEDNLRILFMPINELDEEAQQIDFNIK